MDRQRLEPFQPQRLARRTKPLPDRVPDQPLAEPSWPQTAHVKVFISSAVRLPFPLP
jgi:hypothetical protein